MEDIRIILAVLWIVLMLLYLLGDIIRIFAGDFKAGEMEGKKMTQKMLFGISFLMLIPIVMIFLSITLYYPLIRWLVLILSAFLFVFNITGLPTYPGLYDKFLILVGLIFNIVTFWYAWMWI